MTDNTQLPITEIPDMGIVLQDGTRLSARVWMPENASDEPQASIKNDETNKEEE